MADQRESEQESQPYAPAGLRERFVYVMPERVIHGSSEQEIDLREVWCILWAGKWRIIGTIALFTGVAVAYALLATEWYRAEVLLAPADEKSAPSIGGQLGGLAALAGVSIGGSDSAEALATLKSREFAREFIEDYKLLPVFFPSEWDEKRQRWIASDSRKILDIRDAVRFFREKVLSVSEDRKTNLVTLAVQWKDPEVAAEWASVLVQRLNSRLRERALRTAKVNVEYLQQELARTNVVTLQQAIGSVLENELQKLMLARGNNEFALRIIDSAYPPKDRARPNRKLVVLVGGVLGGMFGLGWVLIGHSIYSRRAVGFPVVLTDKE